MRDHEIHDRPEILDAIVEDTRALGFTMASEPMTGAFLKTLAASKPAGRFLELGTGTGISAAWLLAGMDRESRLLTIDNDADAQRIAQAHLGGDARIEIILADGGEWLGRIRDESFDLIFADAWPGKFEHLEAALGLLRSGGIYVIDDLLPQDSWPEGHAPRVPELMQRIESLPGFTSVRMAWATGLMLVVRHGAR